MRFLSLIIFVLSSGLQAGPKLDKSLTEAFRSAPKSKQRVLINLDKVPDLATFEKREFKTRAERVEALVSWLQRETQDQIDLLKKKTDMTEEIEPLWLTHSAQVVVSQDTLQRLAQAPFIESISLDPLRPIDDLESETPLDAFSWGRPKIGWGIEKMRVPQVWKQGVVGKDVLVAVIDSGANILHPDLKNRVWKNPLELGKDKNGKDKGTNKVDDDKNGFIDDVSGWNFIDNNNILTDTNGHGSQTAGIVGGDGTNGTKTGVAPGAQLMIIKTCCEKAAMFETNVLKAIQYALQNKAQVVSMSLTLKPYMNPNYARWRRASEVVLAGGMIHVNSAGNLGSGQTPRNMGAPATNPPAWFHPEQPSRSAPTSMITIGATSASDQLREYSSTGPVTWESVVEYKDFPYEEGKKQGLIKPEVCAPSEVPSTSLKGNKYTASFGGTSSATPHVAGAVALLLQVKPNLTVAQVTEALEMSARPVGKGFNNQCGAGRVDVPAAISYIQQKFKY